MSETGQRVPGGKPMREFLHLVELLKVQIDRAGVSAVLLVADRKVGEANINISSNLSREGQVLILRSALAKLEAAPAEEGGSR